ncbi:MAG: hypothetical protein M3068_10935 [Gemmatimonadota bacterium]|nr:hypothetical protein [Gemmatimonadota bacterium]
MSSGPGAVFFPPVFRERVRTGIIAGAIAAAATLGVLVGFGRARRAGARPVNAIAHILLGARAFDVLDLDAVVTSTAVALHIASLLVWGILFAMVAGRSRGWRLATAAVAFVLGAALIDFAVLPDRLRPGFEHVLSRPELVLLYAVLAGALAVAVALRRPAASTPRSAP